MQDVHSRALLCHPSTPNAFVCKLEVCVSRGEDGGIRLAYTLTGALGQLRLPALPTEDELWQHTCFEAFIQREGEVSYQEFNFAPSREWAAYAFRRRREREAWSAPFAPQVGVAKSGERLTLNAAIPSETLWAGHRSASLHLGLSAVIEDDTGELSYWALQHPPGRPDFHDPVGFIAVLPPCRRAC